MIGIKILELIEWELRRQRRMYHRLELKMDEWLVEYVVITTNDRDLVEYLIEISKLFHLMNHELLRPAELQLRKVKQAIIKRIIKEEL